MKPPPSGEPEVFKGSSSPRFFRCWNSKVHPQVHGGGPVRSALVGRFQEHAARGVDRGRRRRHVRAASWLSSALPFNARSLVVATVRSAVR